ncbi:hypothetical protein OG871_10180 [Kitasatospora sp. NBC_00374]|uniref:hypothetical protein n=1 Tax=Kitasatospora sp. NBC_00374 TaxID=2975964 RepID=UPI0030E2017C
MSNEFDRNEAEELAAAAREAELAESDVEGHAADVEDEAGFTNINFGCSAN